ncbi:carbohydrate-binding module family 21 protein, partial [Ramaria rubella]
MTLRIKPVALPSLPQEPWTFDVKLERVALEDSALVGHILVRNISFAKWVAVRFTLDSWQTTSEVTARHVTSLHSYTFDRFEFRVRLGDYLNGIESKRLVLCVRFSVEGCEMWDSNGGRNYEVGFERVKKDHVRMATVPSASGSKPGPPLVSDLRDELEKVAQEKHANSSVTIDSNKPAASSLRNADAPLSSRYDFGASLRGPTWTPPSQIRSL